MLATAVAAIMPVLAEAQFARPEQAVRYRQSVMNVMGAHFGRIGAMVNGRVPFDAQQAAANASIVETMAKLPWQAFEEKANLLNTGAKPEIWTDQAKFKLASEKLVAEAAKLSAAARSGNPDQLKTTFGATAASCKSCHDDFRKPQQ